MTDERSEFTDEERLAALMASDWLRCLRSRACPNCHKRTVAFDAPVQPRCRTCNWTLGLSVERMEDCLDSIAEKIRNP